MVSKTSKPWLVIELFGRIVLPKLVNGLEQNLKHDL